MDEILIDKKVLSQNLIFRLGAETKKIKDEMNRSERAVFLASWV